MYRSKKIKSIITALMIAAILLAALCALAFENRTHRAEAAPENGMRVVGYLPTWSYSAYRNIDFTALTHINISFCNYDQRSGEITCDIPDGEMRAIVEKAHGSNVKVIAALGGGGYGEPYRDLISGADKISSLDGKIIAFCEKYDLDGVDLDIEIQSGDSIWNDYGAWVTDLRSACDERGWLLSTATAQWVAGNVSPETFAKFDYINVMAYDDDTRGSISHSSYAFSVSCLNYFHTTKSVPKEKLVLGVPFYGRGYSNGSLDWNSYSSFAELVNIDPANYDRDTYNGIAYTGASTMRRKCELSKEYGGIMIWEITLDAAGEYSLLGVIKEELLPDKPIDPESPDKPTDPDLPENNADKTMTVWIIVISIAGVAVIAAVTLIVVFLVRRRKNKTGEK